MSLLGTLGKSVKEAREMGRKFGIVEAASRGKGRGGFGAIGGVAMDDVWAQGPSGDDGLGGGSNENGLSTEDGYVL